MTENMAIWHCLSSLYLGTDTGGSVRVPAAFCKIYGIRPSHGVVSVDGVVPMAQSFDTVGINSTIQLVPHYVS